MSLASDDWGKKERYMVGRRLRLLRTYKGLTRGQVVCDLGLKNTDTLGNYERGQGGSNIGFILRLARYYNLMYDEDITLSYIFDGIE